MSAMNIPNYLTLLRIAAIPVVVLLYFLPYSWAHSAASILFALAAITDWLDGYLARKLNKYSSFGEFLDPVADKLLVAAALVAITGSDAVPFMVIPAIIIIGREITISALREWMAEIGKRSSVAVMYLGKVKTTLQLVALTILLWVHPDSSAWILGLGITAIWVAAILTLWSMIHYLTIAWQDLKQPAE